MLPIPTSKITQLFVIAKGFAKDYQHAAVSAEHLFSAILHEEMEVVPFLQNDLGKDIAYLKESAELQLRKYPKAPKPLSNPTGDAKVQRIMQEATRVQLLVGELELTPICVLAAICKPNIAFSAARLQILPLDSEEIVKALAAKNDSIVATPPQAAQKSEVITEKSVLWKYCTDLTSLAQEEKLDRVVGREKEIREVVEALGKRMKPNVLLLGEPGVGKTAIVRGLAQKITAQQTPNYLKDLLLLELNIGSLIAGASYKGELEDRLKNVLEAVKALDKAILFIDELHILADNTGTMGSAAINLLKPELASGKLTVIGATTHENYRKFIEKDTAFERRFEKVSIEEPSEKVSLQILQSLRPYYEQHHQIELTDDSLSEAVQLSKRYLNSRFLPDSAIDVMDKAMVAVRNITETTASTLQTLQEQFDDLVAKHESGELTKATFQQQLLEFQAGIPHQIHELLWMRLASKEDIKTSSNQLLSNLEGVGKISMEDEILDLLEELSQLLQKQSKTVDKATIAAIVARQTGIPLGKLQSNELEQLLQLRSHLQSRIIGQDHAIERIVPAIENARAGLTEEGKPIGAFFLVGPTGTGKTHLAQSLVELLFNGDDKSLIRFDMSNFQQENAGTGLVGSPPGYVGYESGGALVNKIRERPYSVVLFDEIEKAHENIFDIFLTILNDGYLTDTLGKRGDFSNAIILFTSNWGSHQIAQAFRNGQIPDALALQEMMQSKFKPEFLGRLEGIGGIVPFAPLTETAILQIFDIELQKLQKRLLQKNITLEISDAVRSLLAKEGYSEKLGARPLKGVIRRKVEHPLARLLIGGELKEGMRVFGEIGEDERILWKLK